VSRRDAAELGRRLDEILAAAERLVGPVTEAEMGAAVAGGTGSLRDAAFRLFRLGLGFVDGMDRGRLVPDRADARAPEDLRDGASVARYGALVRGRVGGWFEGAGPRELARVIDGPEGPRPGWEVLEQVTDEAAGGLRRLQAALARAGRVS
jgi:hypothetical protein